MALTVPEKKFVPDLGSEEMRLVRTQLNLLIDLVAGLVTAADQATYGAFQTAVQALSGATLKKYVGVRENPAQPAFPDVAS